MPVNCQIHYYVFRFYENVKILYKVMCFRLKGVGLLVNAVLLSHLIQHMVAVKYTLESGVSFFGLLHFFEDYFSLNSISVHFNL